MARETIRRRMRSRLKDTRSRHAVGRAAEPVREVAGQPLTRRSFLGAAPGLASTLALAPRSVWAAAPAVVTPRPTDIRIEEVHPRYEEFLYRSPMKFGGRTVDRVTLLHVDCVVSTRAGKVARGFGSMPLGNAWGFPSAVLTFDQTLAAMKALAEQIAPILGGFREFAHPLDIGVTLEPAYLKAAAEVSKSLGLAQAIPKLATLVVASPFDAAVHDAFGKAHGRSAYQTYGSDLVTHDLSRYLGPEFRGELLDRYVLARPQPRMPLYHLIGALDVLEEKDLKTRVGDGLPETFAEWIPREGLTHFKVKLNGDDATWDVERVLAVDAIVTRQERERGASASYYSLDFNERCPNVGYLLEVLRRIRERSKTAFERIQLVEQPTARDLKANRQNVMHEAARLRPVVIDESLTDLESLLLAREMGYTGVALKACKGQTQAMLMAAAAQKLGMFLCVQDLTCPGASLVHSVGIAAHVPGVAAIEANARQYVPAANRGWEDRFPGIFRIKNGTLETENLTGPGLGVVP